MTSFTLRGARPDEMPAIQATWDDIAFARSDDGDRVWVAVDVHGERVGQGRLVPVGEGHVELGGIWTRDDWRGRGVAGALVRALLEAAGDATVWCVPWADLAEFYKGLGLRESARAESAPEKIREKLAYCRARYPRAVALLRTP
ncbi:MAG: GNAT family N-acetyltransferase [Polyangiales bacterium]